jgi:hypothetical protein
MLFDFVQHLLWLENLRSAFLLRDGHGRNFFSADSCRGREGSCSDLIESSNFEIIVSLALKPIDGHDSR